MDLSYDEAIDTRCGGCGESAEGWAFASDGRRVYVCPDCAEALYRYVPEDNIGVAPHPKAQFCRACERLTLTEDMNHQRRCPDCRGAAGDRQMEEQEPGAEAPPQVQAARADAEGAVEWDDEQER